MPSIRIGFSTDFNVTSEQVGIGTTLPTARLDVRGQILSDNAAGGGGISTLTEYQGFLHSKQGIGNTVSIAQTTKGNLNSLSGEIVISGEVTVEDDTPLTGGRLDSLTVTGKFDLPHGGTEDREETPEKGSTRFNQDLGQLEFYTGYEWRTVGSYDGSGRGRAVIGDNSASHIMDFVNIQSLGNALNFGTLSDSRVFSYACASSTRGLWGGGVVIPTIVNTIDYITIASEGNAIDFGDLLSNTGQEPTSCSSSTRGLWGGGYSVPGSSRINVIQYVSISTIGNALDFGDLTSLGVAIGSLSSSTRGVFGGGYRTSPGLINTVDFITIASTGNAVSFGTLSEGSARLAGCSNGTRGLFAGGRAYPSSPGPSSFITNRIEYITVASTGNGQDFGDLTSSNRNMLAAAANSTRGIFAGGYSPTNSNVIDYVTIASTGNAQDFGDLTKAKRGVSACSDSHGGLGGF